MSNARGIMTEVMHRLGKKRNARSQLLEAVVALPKLALDDLSHPDARKLFSDLVSRLGAAGPWSTTAAGVSDPEAAELVQMIRQLDKLVP